MAGSTFSSSSMCLKIGVLILFVVAIVHIIGFSVPRWITLKMNMQFRDRETKAAYHGGLWKHCGCSEVGGYGGCLCVSRANDPGWFNVVKAAETLGLIGLVLSLLLSASLLFHKQTRGAKIINIFFVGMSGILILIGVIWFGINSTDSFNGIDQLIGYIIDDYSIKLSYAYIFCVMSGILSIFVCTPIFLKDLYAHTGESNTPQVTYTAQGQVLVPAQGYAPGGQQQNAYTPMPMQEYQGAPPPSYQPYYEPNNSGLPYKS